MENQDPNTQNLNSQNSAPSYENEAPKVHVGPIIGVVIIIIIIIFGGLYFIGAKVNDEGLLAPTVEEIQNAPDETLGSLEAQGASDEVGAIEEDVNATPLENLDIELGDIEAELNF